MERDAQIRLAAAAHVKRLAIGNTLTAEELRAGFHFEGERIPLINPQRGIFKPARRTRIDQRKAHEASKPGKLYSGKGLETQVIGHIRTPSP